MKKDVEKFRELLNYFGLHYHEFKSAEIENELIKMYEEKQEKDGMLITDDFIFIKEWL